VDANTFIQRVHTMLVSMGREADGPAYHYIWNTVASQAPPGWSPYGN
jgi:hypothetical protein